VGQGRESRRRKFPLLPLGRGGRRGLGGGIPPRPSERQRPHPPPCSFRAEHHKKVFFSFLEEKIRRAQIGKSKENFFVGRAGLRHGGGAASLGVFLKMGSSNVQNFPPDRTFAFWERDCLAASPLGMAALRKAQSGRIPRRDERKGSGQIECLKS